MRFSPPRERRQKKPPSTENDPRKGCERSNQERACAPGSQHLFSTVVAPRELLGCPTQWSARDSVQAPLCHADWCHVDATFAAASVTNTSPFPSPANDPAVRYATEDTVGSQRRQSGRSALLRCESCQITSVIRYRSMANDRYEQGVPRNRAARIKRAASGIQGIPESRV
jgi:hypothetical protein